MPSSDNYDILLLKAESIIEPEISNVVAEFWKKYCKYEKWSVIPFYKLIELIYHGKIQVWFIVNQSQTVGMVFAEILELTKFETPDIIKKSYNLYAVSGIDVRKWTHLLPVLEAYAKHSGCEQIEFSGRLGWAKLIPDYEQEKRATYTKVLGK